MDWQAGQKVAVYTHANGGAADSVRPKTIERVTQTQVVLVNGERYRRSDGRQVAQMSDYGPWRELREWDDPQVRRLRARQAVNRLVRQIGEAQRDHKDPTALLDYIDQETARVRAVVEKLTKED